MNVWPENTNKIITIISPPDSTIKVFSRLVGSGNAYTQITNPAQYVATNTWEVTANFPLGEYVIKVETGYITRHVELKVVPYDQYVLTNGQERISSEISTLKDTINKKNSFKVVG